MLERYAATRALQHAVRGREAEVLEALGWRWDEGYRHLTCPYPDHAADHPSWRRAAAKVRVFGSRLGRGSDSLLDMDMKVEDLDVAAAKRLVTEAGHMSIVRRRLGAADFLYLAAGPRPGLIAREGRMTGPASGSGRRLAGPHRGGRHGR